MAVHWNPANKYKPRNFKEEIQIASAYHPFSIVGDHKPKCTKCKKRMRGANHDCKNGK